MIKKQFRMPIICSVILMLNCSASAQIINSIYSMYGVGQVIDSDYGINRAMGGAGIAFQSGGSINILNPASYLGMLPNSFNVEAGAYGIYNFARNSKASQTDGYINLNYFLGNLYLSDRWALSFGLTPISSVNYEINSSDEVGGEMTTYAKNFTGSGGLNQGFIGQSYQVYKGLTVGFNAAFIFGNLAQTETGGGSDSYTEYKLVDRRTAYDYYLDYGLQYTINRQDWRYTLGLIYGPNKSLNTTNDLEFTCNDTMMYLDQDDNTRIVMPRKIGIGIAANRNDKFRVGLDYVWKGWSDVTFTNTKFSTDNSSRVSLGMEFIPGQGSNPYKGFSYRLGANFENSYLVVDNIQIKSYGVSAGFGFPISQRNIINLAVEYGEQGTQKNGLIKNSYVGFYLSFALHEFWYSNPR